MNIRKILLDLTAVMSAAVTAFTLCAEPFAAYAAAEWGAAKSSAQIYPLNGYTDIEINSAEDFLEFAESCTLDSNTRGKRYILCCNLILSDFKPIPTFSGIFDGNGHSITGIRIESSGSEQGLFRYVEKEGQVKNLTVKGRIAPTGSASECGGIAGVNRGRILNCSFGGMVSGKERCGGIAGINEETGLISSCSADGLVQARICTGGVAGENRGVIISCTNNASVNISAADETVVPENINAEDIYSAEAIADITDEGGIAGYSCGTVQGCKNYGSIGYRHVGYNAGGIIGRQDGYVGGCENYGTVNGRKDTGGIVGQAEPHVSLLLSESTFNKLRTELDELNVIIDSTVSDADLHSGEIGDSFEDINESLESARASLDSFLDQTDEMINENIDSINELSSRISDLTDMAAPASESFELASDIMSEALADLSEAAELMGEASDTAGEGMDKLFPALDDMSEAVSSLSDASSSFGFALDDLRSSLGDEHLMQLAVSELETSIRQLASSAGIAASSANRITAALNGLKNDPQITGCKDLIRIQLNRLYVSGERLSENLQKAEGTLQVIRLMIEGGITGTEAYRPYVEEIIGYFSDGSVYDVFDSLLNVITNISAIMASQAVLNLKDELSAVSDELGFGLSGMGAASSQLAYSAGQIADQTDISALFGFIEHLQDTNSSLGASAEPAGDLIDRITESWDYFDEASASLTAAVYLASGAADKADSSVKKIKDGISSVNDILDYFSGKSRIEFTGAEDSLIGARRELSSSLEELIGLSGSFGETAESAVHDLSEDLRRINEKASEVADTLLDLVDELDERSADISDYTEDISSKDPAGRSDGKIDRCSNYGQINGDLCVGGIAGAMAVEYDFDPEGDIETVGSRSFNFMYQTKTVIRDSVNYGEIISKKGRSGGIAGEMSTGCIIDCLGFGNVSSLDGEYSGGIAGRSEAAVVGSSAKCRVSGREYVGGIAGYSHDMSGCRSFVVIEDGAERIGAVSGYADGESTDNVFIDSGAGGIDGISYSGKAFPVSYDDMAGLDGIPDDFLSFALVFTADGETVDNIPVNYGESLPEERIPAVPEKDGVFGKWEEFDYGSITFSAEIEAVYSKYVTAVESEEKRENGLPVIVLEGSFSDSDRVEAHAADGAENSASETWDVTIPQDGSDTHIIRYLSGIKPSRAVLTVTENGEARSVDAEIDGQYLVMSVRGNSVSISAEEKKLFSPAAAVIPAAAAAAVIIII
ncbi:MAG: hypothetical protein NC120_12890, partial [Ruminococcus sp.]|nr:hypothetical protein [Ruminococcus sp.]